MIKTEQNQSRTTFFSPDAAIGRHLPSGTRRRVKRPGTGERLLCVSALDRLDEEQIGALQRIRKREGWADRRWVLLCREDYPPAEIPEKMAAIGATPSRVCLHTVGGRAQEEQFVTRLVATAASADRAERILDAYWVGETLVVHSADLERIEAPLKLFPSLQGASREDRAVYEIDGDGSFVYWPRLDVHLGWEQFVQAVRPESAVRAKQESIAFNKRYGAAIRALRERAGLKRSDVEGLTVRHLGRIENGESRATAKSIRKLAESHGMEVSEYMNRLAEAM